MEGLIINTVHFDSMNTKDINKIINTYIDSKAKYAAYSDDVLLRKITFELMRYNRKYERPYLDDAGILLRLAMDHLTLNDFINSNTLLAVQLIENTKTAYFKPYDIINTILSCIFSNIPADINDTIDPAVKGVLFSFLENLHNYSTKNTFEYFNSKPTDALKPKYKGLNDVYKQLRNNSNQLADKNQVPLYIPSENELHKYYETNGKGVAVEHTNETTPLLAYYVDDDPIVVKDKNNKTYIFDELSGSLQEVDIRNRNVNTSNLLSKNDVESQFKQHDLSPKEFKKIFSS